MITVCLNAAHCIEETIKSVLAQTYPNLEYIIIDGGSTDGTLEIVNRYRERITKIVSEKDRGIYEAMNKGIRLATGEWLNFMNAGDRFYSENTLNDLQPDFLKAKDQIVLYGNLAFKTNDQLPILHEVKPADKWFSNALIVLYHQAMFIKREAFLKYGAYDESFKIAGDTYWNNMVYRLRKDKRFFFTNTILCIYNLKEGASSDLKNFFSVKKEYWNVVNRIYGGKILPKVLFLAAAVVNYFERIVVALVQKTYPYKLFRAIKYRRRYLPDESASGKT